MPAGTSGHNILLVDYEFIITLIGNVVIIFLHMQLYDVTILQDVVSFCHYAVMFT